jgi:hypothetical protein
VIAYEQGLRDGRRYAEATARVMAEGIGTASREERLTDVATARARAQLYDTIVEAALPPLRPVPLLERHPAAPRIRDADRLRA